MRQRTIIRSNTSRGPSAGKSFSCLAIERGTHGHQKRLRHRCNSPFSPEGSIGKKGLFDEEGPGSHEDWLEALWFGFSAAVRRQGRLESGRINMPGSWDVTRHNNNKNLSVPFPAVAGPMRPSRSFGSREIPRDYDHGSVFTNHSTARGEQSAPSAPSAPSSAPYDRYSSLLLLCPLFFSLSLSLSFSLPPSASASASPSPSLSVSFSPSRPPVLARCRELFHLRCTPAQLANKLRPVASFRLSEDT